MTGRHRVLLDEIPIPSSRDTGSAHLTGVLGVPVGAGPWPGVVMVHEAFGVTDVMRRQIERLTAAGYLVLMPDLFSEGGARRCLTATFRALLAGKGRAFSDIESARILLTERTDCTGLVGVIGFCMGGGFALMAAPRGFDVASVNYGRLPQNIDTVLRGACPIIGSYGGIDASLPGAAAALGASLQRLGIAHEVTEYPDAGHSFLNDSESGPPLLRPILRRILGAGPHPESAALAWKSIEAFFADHLSATPQR